MSAKSSALQPLNCILSPNEEQRYFLLVVLKRNLRNHQFCGEDSTALGAL